MRVIASVYTGSTERRALDELIRLGAQVRVSYEIARTRLHAKAWLFHRASGLHTAYIGSSNLTHAAQIDGLEWNVRVSATQNPEVVERFKATFEQYWQEPEFEDYEPERDAERLEQALSQQSRGGKPDDRTIVSLLVDVAPKPHQEVALEALASERLRGHRRNLVVAATGTGKTWIAAFDFKRLRREGAGHSLLFVAHREEILRQSQQVFQLVLREPEFGERLVGGERPTSGHHVFASVQSLASRIDDIEPDAFDVVIVDEFHHAAAASYERLLSRLKPKFLLGLTATPERADGKSVLDWFDGRIASESRLWDALDQGLLCPFHYFGVNDTTDLSTVRFERGRYVLGELDNVLTGDHVRALRVRHAVEEYLAQPHQMRALGFCAGVKHAHFMAMEFGRFGYPAVALDATTPRDERRAAVVRLRNGDLRAIFTVDLFNEGVDLPEVDTVLMLRPTESATVFLQQLGRGLRWAEGKRVLTVLDLVGQVRREYRYDIRYRALLGGTRHQARRAVEAGFPLLPPGCALNWKSWPTVFAPSRNHSTHRATSPWRATRPIPSARSWPRTLPPASKAHSCCLRVESSGTNRRGRISCSSPWRNPTRTTPPRRATPTIQFPRPCSTGSRRTALHPIRRRVAAISNSERAARTSSCSYASASVAAEGRPFLTTASVMPGTAVTSRNAR